MGAGGEIADFAKFQSCSKASCPGHGGRGPRSQGSHFPTVDLDQGGESNLDIARRRIRLGALLPCLHCGGAGNRLPQSGPVEQRGRSYSRLNQEGVPENPVAKGIGGVLTRTQQQSLI